MYGRFAAAKFAAGACLSGTLALFCAVASAAAPQTPASPPWQAEIQRRHQELIDRNGPGTNPKLRDELLKMRDEDQAARGLGPRATHTGHVEVASNLAEIDAALTAELKTIIQNNGWPTIARVGIDASNAAMLILTHTRDHAWQASVLPGLTSLADHRQIDGAPLALAIDKELVAEGKLQRYGSQFKLVDGEMAMYGVEDPAGLDKRRALVMLPPMEVYEQQLAQMYHLKVSKKIVSAAK
jgi:hypothetical protein